MQKIESTENLHSISVAENLVVVRGDRAVDCESDLCVGSEDVPIYASRAQTG